MIEDVHFSNYDGAVDRKPQDLGDSPVAQIFSIAKLSSIGGILPPLDLPCLSAARCRRYYSLDFTW